jgi:hypothetical protein
VFVFVLHATELTERVLELKPTPQFRLCSLCEGVTLLRVFAVLSELTRRRETLPRRRQLFFAGIQLTFKWSLSSAPPFV